jgi:RNA polymerase sigma-70 factor, ECF subfamily
MTRSERKLIEKAQKGDKQAFETLLHNYQRMIYSLVYRFFPNSEDADDMAQEAAVHVYIKLNRFYFRSEFSTWLCRVVYHLCLNQLDKKKRRPQAVSMTAETERGRPFEPVSEAADAKDEVWDQERRALLEKAMAKLEPRYRMALQLFYLETISYQEISRIMSIPLGTVKSYLHRARRQLKKELYRMDGGAFYAEM